MSSDREDRKAEFLRRHGLGEAVREPLAGDASTRRYERLHPPGRAPLIFMDQPPSVESLPCPPQASEAERLALGYNACARLAAGRIEAFVACAGYLRGLGLSAPTVAAADAAAGLAILEDLGDGLYARLIEQGAPEPPLYEAAVEALVRLHRETPPETLAADGLSWPLLSYDALALRTGGDMFIEWWPKYAAIPAFAPDAVAEWNALWDPIRAAGAAGATVFAHRDYHAENLIWLPERSGVARVGLLDFQDALRAHPAWDLLSLLQDVRRDVSPDLEAAMLERYLAANPSVERDAFLADYAGLAALNAARILFIFARQAAHFGRPRYRQFLPRVWRMLDRNLAKPPLAPIRGWFDRNVGEAR